jgi:exopolysaccharide biosynthesis polyprenyl glycosylphosphotransferase
MAHSNHLELEFLWKKAWYRMLAALFDCVSLFLAWEATVDLRILLNSLMALHLSRGALAGHAPSAFTLVLIWAAVSVWLRLYGAKPHARAGGYLRSVMNATALLSVVLITYGFFSRQIGADDLSRSFVLLFAPVSFLTLMASNYAILTVSTWIGRRYRFEERVAVAGDGPHAEHLVEQLTRCGGPARVVGFILPRSAAVGISRHRAPVLGTTAAVAEVINRAKLDRIIFANGSLPEEEATACTRIARRMGVATGHALAGLVDQDLETASLRIGNGLAIVELNLYPFTRKQEIVKRAFDVCFSAALIVILLPLFAILAALIKLTSPGPVFYVSDRVGRGGRHFTFYKFRTMRDGADTSREQAAVNEQQGHLFKMRWDPRVTPLGRFMRRFSLDELPQLTNVFVGDMSLVGPRPLPARDLEPDGLSSRFVVWARARSEAVPGITCLWQIRGRSDLPFDKMIELDLEYVRNWSLALDLEILLETPLAVLSGRGAY